MQTIKRAIWLVGNNFMWDTVPQFTYWGVGRSWRNSSPHPQKTTDLLSTPVAARPVAGCLLEFQDSCRTFFYFQLLGISSRLCVIILPNMSVAAIGSEVTNETGYWVETLQRLSNEYSGVEDVQWRVLVFRDIKRSACFNSSFTATTQGIVTPMSFKTADVNI